MNSFLQRLKLLFCFLLAIYSGQNAFANQTDTNSIFLKSERFLLDPSSSFTAKEVMEMDFNATEDDAESQLKKLNSKRSIWIKISVVNPTHEYFNGYIYSRGITERTYYWTKNDTLFSDIRGFFYPRDDDRMYFDRFKLPIELEPLETRTFYIRSREFVRYIHYTPLVTAVADSGSFQKFKRPAGSSPLVNLHVFFTGLLVFQLLYIIIQWSLLRRTEYFYYALYIISIFAYFWPRHVLTSMSLENVAVPMAHFVASANDILLVLPTLFYFRFSRFFIDLPQLQPRWNKILKRFEYVFIGLIVFVALANSFVPNDLPKNAIVMSCVFIQFILTIIALAVFFMVKTLLTRFVLIAGVIAISSHVLSMVISIFFYPALNIAPIAITMVGIIIEIAIFNSGLLFKGREMEKDKFNTQMQLLKEVEAKQHIQLEYASVRDKIARDLHDDIGSTLSSVSIYSYAAKQKLAKGEFEQTKDLIASIEKNALSTLNSMGDLVWAINPSNDSMVKLIERLNSFGYEILSAKECSFIMIADPLFYTYESNLEQRRNLLLICKEALNNSAKYAEATKVQIEIKPRDKGFRVIITDNGKGFNPQEISNGNGLSSMKTRASNLSDYFRLSSGEEGTSITFDI